MQLNCHLKTIRAGILICLASFSLTACQLYQMDIRQGNHVTQEMVDKLRVGQSKMDVHRYMGTAAVIPVINLDRWDYQYYFKPGDGGPIEHKALTLYFKGDKLQSYSGDWNLAHLPKRK